jgi:hypothetical protein
MDSNFPDENVIREYLLGTLPEQDWDEIEQKLLSDEEFAEFVDSIEDDIIEEYLTVQNHFLRPPERQRKLLFASAMRSNLRKEPEALVYAPRVLPPNRASRLYWGATLGAAAVLLLLTVPLGVYTAMLHYDLATAQAKVHGAESTLAQAGAHVADLEKALALRGGHDVVNLLRPVNRAGGQVPTFSVTSTAKSIEVHIALDPPISPPYHADLQVTNNSQPDRVALWSQDNVQPTDSGELIFRIPYYGPGTYSLAVTRSHDHPSASPTKYSFEAVE